MGRVCKDAFVRSSHKWVMAEKEGVEGGRGEGGAAGGEGGNSQRIQLSSLPGVYRCFGDNRVATRLPCCIKR